MWCMHCVNMNTEHACIVYIRGWGLRRVLKNYSPVHIFTHRSGIEPATLLLPVKLLNQQATDNRISLAAPAGSCWPFFDLWGLWFQEPAVPCVPASCGSSGTESKWTSLPRYRDHIPWELWLLMSYIPWELWLLMSDIYGRTLVHSWQVFMTLILGPILIFYTYCTRTSHTTHLLLVCFGADR